MNLDQLQGLAARIRAILPGAIIGGGAVRDTFLGASVKDIDVFLQAGEHEFAQLADQLAQDLGGTIESSQAYVHAPSYDIVVPSIPYPINLVLRDCDVIEDVSDYDFGISQIALDGTTVHKTEAFLKDVRDNTLTYMHAAADKPEWHVKSSANRMLRILAKYPSLTTVGCEKLHAVIAETMSFA